VFRQPSAISVKWAPVNASKYNWSVNYDGCDLTSNDEDVT